MASDLIKEATDANWKDVVLSSDKPVLVDFWATWCAPCRAIAPLLEQLAAEEGGVQIVKLDVQSNMKTAQQYKVSNIPTLLVFKGGKEVGRKVGAGGGLAGLKSLVQPHL